MDISIYSVYAVIKNVPFIVPSSSDSSVKYFDFLLTRLRSRAVFKLHTGKSRCNSVAPWEQLGLIPLIYYLVQRDNHLIALNSEERWCLFPKLPEKSLQLRRRILDRRGRLEVVSCHNTNKLLSVWDGFFF